MPKPLIPNAELKSRGIVVQLMGLVLLVASLPLGALASLLGVPFALSILLGIGGLIFCLLKGRKIYNEGKTGLPEGTMPEPESTLFSIMRLGGALLMSILFMNCVLRGLDALAIIAFSQNVPENILAYAQGSILGATMMAAFTGAILFIVFPKYDKLWKKVTAWSLILFTGLLGGVTLEAIKAGRHTAQEFQKQNQPQEEREKNQKSL